MFEEYPDILTVNEVRQILFIGKDKAYRMLQSGEIPAVKIGRDWRISKRVIEAIIK